MPAERSGYWVVPTAIDVELLARQIEVAAFYPPRCLGAPIGSAGLIGNWDPPSMGRPAQRVPVRGESVFLHRPHVAVKFRNLRERSPSKGTFINVGRDVRSVQTLKDDESL